jgi:S-adenosylmethionine-dependent methyltransferase
MLNIVKRILKRLLFLHKFSPHEKLGISYFNPTDQQVKEIKDSLVENYFSNFGKPFPVDNPEAVNKGFLPMWMDASLLLRIEEFRKEYVPFLNAARPLKNSVILDVGCGTGSSLIPFAETGATVYGIDIDQGALEVAKKRCSIYNSAADISLISATEIETFKPEITFDFIIFSASLEHMYLNERLQSLRAAWNRLKPGGILGIIECPNRLWYYDAHTSDLPFFEWLPNNLALQYIRFSGRDYVNKLPAMDKLAEAEDKLVRIGRGMSFHEIDLAIGAADKLDVAESMINFKYTNSNWLEKRRISKRFDIPNQKFLREKSKRNLNIGFFEPWLNLAIRK